MRHEYSHRNILSAGEWAMELSHSINYKFTQMLSPVYLTYILCTIHIIRLLYENKKLTDCNLKTRLTRFCYRFYAWICLTRSLINAYLWTHNPPRRRTSVSVGKSSARWTKETRYVRLLLLLLLVAVVQQQTPTTKAYTPQHAPSFVSHFTRGHPCTLREPAY